MKLDSDEITPTGKRIVVTGGTGFIGRALLEELRFKFFPVLVPVALARASSDLVSLNRLLDYPATAPSVVVGDLNDIPSLQSCVADAAVVIHLAADMDFFKRDVSALIHTNVTGTRNLLEACAREAEIRKRAMRFLYVSTTEVIGCTEGLGKADENVPFRPDSDYGRSKMLAEDVVKEYCDRLDTVVARPTGVYGPGERFFFFELMQMVASGIALCAPSPMTGKLMFTHIDDVVAGLILCATHADAKGNIYNLCADDAVTNRAIIETLADTLGYPRPVLFLNVKVGVALMSCIAPLINWRKRRVFIYHPKTVQQSMTDREYSNRRIRALGFVPKYAMLAGARQTLLHELRAGSIRKGLISSTLKGSLHFISVVAFTVSRMVQRRRATDS